MLRFEELKVYPWNVLYSTLSYDSSLIQPNLKLDELAETVHDERSNILYVLIIGCAHGTFDKKTHPVLQMATSPPKQENLCNNRDCGMTYQPK